MSRSPGGAGSGVPDREIRILSDAEALARTAAAEFARTASAAVRERGRFAVALSGGSTPRRVYALLAEDDSLRSEVPWDRTHVFWGDERPVPPDHPDSNYRMAREALLSRVPVPPGNIHRIRGEDPVAARAAGDYARILREFFRLPEGKFPRFDLVLLGLGTDGHTASLFPGTAALREERLLAVPNRVERLGTERITLTFPVLNGAGRVVFLVSGEEKAGAVRAALGDPPPPDPPPARRIRPERGSLLWLLDRPAARLLQGRD